MHLDDRHLELGSFAQFLNECQMVTVMTVLPSCAHSLCIVLKLYVKVVMMAAAILAHYPPPLQTALIWSSLLLVGYKAFAWVIVEEHPPV